MPGGIARHQFLAKSGKRARQGVERRAGEEHSGANRDDLPVFIEINLLDRNLDAEHDGRKRQAKFLLDHVEKTHRLLTVIVTVDDSL